VERVEPSHTGCARAGSGETEQRVFELDEEKRHELEEIDERLKTYDRARATKKRIAKYTDKAAQLKEELNAVDAELGLIKNWRAEQDIDIMWRSFFIWKRSHVVVQEAVQLFPNSNGIGPYTI